MSEASDNCWRCVSDTGSIGTLCSRHECLLTGCLSWCAEGWDHFKEALDEGLLSADTWDISQAASGAGDGNEDGLLLWEHVSKPIRDKSCTLSTNCVFVVWIVVIEEFPPGWITYSALWQVRNGLRKGWEGNSQNGCDGEGLHVDVITSDSCELNNECVKTVDVG